MRFRSIFELNHRRHKVSIKVDPVNLLACPNNLTLSTQTDTLAGCLGLGATRSRTLQAVRITAEA